MAFITVITPTYNRAHTLLKLYESLCNQSCIDFEWLIIDDGSSDNTEQIIGGFTALFSIKYIKKKNGGKHTALNVGIKEVTTDLTIIVDSDDQLMPNAIDTIKHYYKKYQSDMSIGALSFFKCYSNGKPVINMDKSEFVDSYIHYRIKKNKPGDMAEVFLTRVLKEYPFPQFEEERFLSEDVVWIEIGKKYLFVFINIPIYICEYMDDGLTVNDKLSKFRSPLGSMTRGMQLMTKECGFIINIKGAIIYNCYKIEFRNNIPKNLKVIGRKKILVLLTKPFGLIFNYIWKMDGLKDGRSIK